MSTVQPFSPLVEQALELAAQWHEGTYRKSRWREAAFVLPDGADLHVPVMAHVTAVALTVQRAGWDDSVVAAAFLHDALEDPNRYGEYLPYERLLALMGEEVARLVAAVTERRFDAEGQLRSWRARKEDYAAHLAAVPEGAVAVSFADKLHNLWTMNRGLERGESPFQSTSSRKALGAGPEEQVWFYQAVLWAGHSHSDRRLEPLRSRLQDELARFADLVKVLPG